MKAAIFTVALLIGGAAIAQTNPAAEPDPAPVPAPVTTAAPAADVSEMGMTAQTDMVGQIVQPGNAAPERDARGIAVLSDPAVAPAGFNQPPGPATGMGGPLLDVPAALAPQPATQSYPACTRAVTDHCVQTYERGRGRR